MGLPDDPPTGATILLVDDTRANLVALDAVLAPLGARRARATSGEEALAKLDPERCAVVLMDVHMPTMDGFEAARRIRADPATRHVPIVFLTADVTADVRRAYELGASDLLTKPFDPDAIRAKVLVFLELYRQREEIARLRAREREELQRRVDAAVADLRAVTARFATTLRSIGDAVIAADAAGRVTFVNPAAEAITGWTDAAARGRPLREVFAVHDAVARTPLDDTLLAVLRGSDAAPLGGDAVLTARDGARRVVAGNLAPIREDAGALAGVVVVFRDETHARRAAERERVLADATAALGSSLELATTLRALARLTVPRLADWCVVHVRSETGELEALETAHSDPARVAWAREIMARYPPDPNARRGAAKVVRTGRSEFVPKVTDELLVEAARDAEHLELLRGLGFTSYMCVPISAQGRPIGALSFIAAESARRYEPADLAFAEELARRAGVAIEHARLYSAAQEANRAKDEFLSMVSHELRTPLTAILGWAHILQGGRAESTARAIEAIARNARAQARIIDDVLDVSRIVTGKLQLVLKSVDLAAVVHAARDAVQPSADAKGVALDVAVDPDAGAIVGDADRLQQVVWNLLANAIKFTPEKGRIEVRASRDGGDARIVVRDTGRGIDASFLPHVFERFRQADSSTTRTFGGLGLGLAIVRHIVELHGGRVFAASAGEGRGATFTVVLPTRGPSEGADGLARSPSTPPAPAAPRLDGARVLVVDDEADARDVVATILADAGAEVRAASSAVDALAGLAAFRPDVLVSDLAMPGEDGYALLRAVRAWSAAEGHWFPAVALTAHARDEDRDRALAAGFHAHVAKPVEAGALVEAVARALASKPE